MGKRSCACATAMQTAAINIRVESLFVIGFVIALYCEILRVAKVAEFFYVVDLIVEFEKTKAATFVK